MTDLRHMTLGEAEAYRQGRRDAETAWRDVPQRSADYLAGYADAWRAATQRPAQTPKAAAGSDTAPEAEKPLAVRSGASRGYDCVAHGKCPRPDECEKAQACADQHKWHVGPCGAKECAVECVVKSECGRACPQWAYRVGIDALRKMDAPLRDKDGATHSKNARDPAPVYRCAECDAVWRTPEQAAACCTAGPEAVRAPRGPVCDLCGGGDCPTPQICGGKR